MPKMSVFRLQTVLVSEREGEKDTQSGAVQMKKYAVMHKRSLGKRDVIIMRANAESLGYHLCCQAKVPLARHIE